MIFISQSRCDLPRVRMSGVWDGAAIIMAVILAVHFLALPIGNYCFVKCVYINRMFVVIHEIKCNEFDNHTLSCILVCLPWWTADL